MERWQHCRGLGLPMQNFNRRRDPRHKGKRKKADNLLAESHYGAAAEAQICACQIPFDWLSAAAYLPGKSLHAGIALWYLAGRARSSRVPLSNVASQAFGLDRNAKYRALEWLEEAGLIAVERKTGQAPIVTVLEVRSGTDE